MKFEEKKKELVSLIFKAPWDCARYFEDILEVADYFFYIASDQPYAESVLDIALKFNLDFCEGRRRGE
jgi:hypothetical protein